MLTPTFRNFETCTASTILNLCLNSLHKSQMHLSVTEKRTRSESWFIIFTKVVCETLNASSAICAFYNEIKPWLQSARWIKTYNHPRLTSSHRCRHIHRKWMSMYMSNLQYEIPNLVSNFPFIGILLDVFSLVSQSKYRDFATDERKWCNMRYEMSLRSNQAVNQNYRFRNYGSRRHSTGSIFFRTNKIEYNAFAMREVSRIEKVIV